MIRDQVAGKLVQLRVAGEEHQAAAPASDEASPDARAVRPGGGNAFIETYGCQMNVSDTELMSRVLTSQGYALVDDPAQADVIVVNTCAIRENAERRVRGRVGQLQQYRVERPELVLAVTGCMAQRVGNDLLAQNAGVDLVAGPDAYRRLGEAIEEIRQGELPRGQTLLELDADENYEGISAVRREGVTAWITVQRGCDHRCTFCIVPYVRGSEKNREAGAVLNDVRLAVADGFTEVTLLGQTVNSYESDDWDFARLLRGVARVPGIRRVRFTSPHPNDVNQRLIDVMSQEEAVCKQLHLPLQSGSNRVLRRMVRRYTAERFLDTVDRVRAAIPDITLSTDVIVGFPGETEADFDETISVLQTARFDDAYLYRFSARDGTPATRLPPADSVPDAEARRRLATVIDVHRRIQREINLAQVGRIVEVLVERSARSEGDLLGRTEGNKVVAFPGRRARVGEYHKVRIVSTSGATFRGEQVA
ncbi:MAG: tRNA (N6-isopentenyl adenosine(37)-C2)-methylthiotransferase MiaB [Gemmatimonadota bacterium]